MPASDDAAQLRRTVRALELLQQSEAAYERGDTVGLNDAFAASADECPLEWNLLQDGMRIGQVPQPGTAEWREYISAARARLDELCASAPPDLQQEAGPA
jgi:hypothetical protein